MHTSACGPTSRRERRRADWPSIEGRTFDIAVVGGGINGASIFSGITDRGHSAVLLEQGDFASGTSQASAMMIWGGLLYLSHYDFANVRRLCSARERMLDRERDWVRPTRYRYLLGPHARHRGGMLRFGLYLYWLLGNGRRSLPRCEQTWPGQDLLRGNRGESFVFEDAALAPSDARFVLRWVLTGRNDSRVPLNYCALEGGAYDHAARSWRLEVTDRLLDRPSIIRARCVVNAAGCWTDRINERFERASPFRHVFSKGVSIALRRDPRFVDPVVFGTGHADDCMVLIPWGPVALWGSTETPLDRLDGGYAPDADDLRLLLREYNDNFAEPIEPSDIISIRTGVRPIVVPRSVADPSHTLGLSRRSRVHIDDQAPWISVYGGKMTDCTITADRVAAIVRRFVGRAGANPAVRNHELTRPPAEHFPGLADPVLSAQWCADHEMCWTLDDYLRRRTNIAQWVPRAGLGADSEHKPALTRLAAIFHDGGLSPQQHVQRYDARVRDQFDSVIASAASLSQAQVLVRSPADLIGAT